MCSQCQDSLENKSTRRTLVVLVLFSVTLSALGISCYALLTVQKLSKDLNALRFVLSRSTVEPAKQPSYGFINNLNRDELSPGPIYETPPDRRTENLRNQVRFKRSLDSEKHNEKSDDDTTLEENTFGTSTKTSIISFDRTDRISVPDGNVDHTINNVNEDVNTHKENSGVDATLEFPNNKRENFETTSKNFIQTNDTSIPSIENVRIISNIKDIQKTPEENNRTYQVSLHEKDEEILKPEGQENNNKKININAQLSLPSLENPNIPSLIEDAQYQMNHNIKKKNVNYDDVESFTPEYNVPRNVYRHRQRGRNGNQLEIIDEFSPQAGRLKSLTAIHLNGDTSQYTLGIHTNYKGNGHLRHPQKTFVDWKMSDWVDTISATNSFHLKSGVITVEESGLYFIYAQIYYLDEHDSNGYMVRRNSDNILHCKVTAPSSERLMKGNTCYTGAVVYLDTNDRISLDDISDGRYTLFIPGYSFFGMIKIGDIKGK